MQTQNEHETVFRGRSIGQVRGVTLNVVQNKPHNLIEALCTNIWIMNRNFLKTSALLPLKDHLCEKSIQVLAHLNFSWSKEVEADRYLSGLHHTSRSSHHI